ncbi:hypothetical protein QJS10_CPA08g01741 [Acorus calamus]|uniref:Uncharacterized protein n=1 Tax=Acorus calamus TaxID=4465 RepID=A0AAV9EDA7_ACOCL|nr:hypothetical protein QJS10_CPA08g01741 [Acorus calamus]
MEEEAKTSPKNSLPGTPRKLSIPDSPLACDKRPPPLEIASPSSSNARPATLQKQMSVRNCLCSPTTHVGSFGAATTGPPPSVEATTARSGTSRSCPRSHPPSSEAFETIESSITHCKPSFVCFLSYR